ncbi:hypothetical protein FGO68_gene16370 [Halteria grandinella]|uniref:Uncharacterized protein n=1 Tax=Halteria grandinella TaxID=5974 RepID=A0A8J8NKL2_HALGN|nr:hypothetical protein FGO68_gene16370 [Halteria grandinella]
MIKGPLVNAHLCVHSPVDYHGCSLPYFPPAVLPLHHYRSLPVVKNPQWEYFQVLHLPAHEVCKSTFVSPFLHVSQLNIAFTTIS